MARTGVCALLLAGAMLSAACGQRSVAGGTTAAGSVPAPPAAADAALFPGSAASGPGTVPRFAHIVVAVVENHASGEIIGNSDAPFLNHLAATGAVLTQSYAITHPSEPNYLALFSGSTQGLTDDSCPRTYRGPNLGQALLAAGDTFTGYSEDLPRAGFTGCSAGSYARKHSPWVDFTNLPGRVNQPMTAFPAALGSLPTVAFVIPNLEHDMHDGTVAAADGWLRTHLGAYADWARTHNSLLIITTDEDDHSAGNHIATILTGAHVRTGRYDARADHYAILRTILDSQRLRPFANTVNATPVLAPWTG